MIVDCPNIAELTKRCVATVIGRLFVGTFETALRLDVIADGKVNHSGIVEIEVTLLMVLALWPECS